MKRNPSTQIVRAVSVPARFFHDHEDRDLPTPVIIQKDGKRRRYLIPLFGPETDELLADAKHYADKEVGWETWQGLKSSARATVKAIEEARAEFGLKS